jgi:hypothetical protein
VQSQYRETEVVHLEAYKRIDQPARAEVSGIIKSRNLEDTYWVHGDSGNEDRIYAINEKGEVISEDKDYKGTELIGAKNKDWEDIAVFPDGRLVVADLGNNCHCREDLKIFVINEPDPVAEEVEVLNEYRIRYPASTGLASLIFDKIPNAEGVFVKSGTIHVITKESGSARLFQLQNPDSDSLNMLVEKDRFEFGELVTGADISPDEKTLAVLTRRDIWIFYLEDQQKLFQNSITKIPIRGTQQAESIAFSGDHLIVAEENGDLYKIPLDL